MSDRGKATCHPNRYNASDGLCETCRRGRPNLCGHPERRHVARRMCASCYAKSRPRYGRRPIERSVVVAKLAEQGGVCAYCLLPLAIDKATADHIDPAGSDEPDNVAAACGPCNTRKGAGPAPSTPYRVVPMRYGRHHIRMTDIGEPQPFYAPAGLEWKFDARPDLMRRPDGMYVRVDTADA